LRIGDRDRLFWPMRITQTRARVGARWVAQAALALTLAVSSSACVADDEDLLQLDESVDSTVTAEEVSDRALATETGAATVTDKAAITPTFRAGLVPQTGISGTQRVNFAIPLPAGRITDPAQIRIGAGADNREIRAARRVLARHPDGSPRSVQIQVDISVTSFRELVVQIGTASTMTPLTMASVASTLVSETSGPRVWVLLPATWLADSGVAGPVRAQSEFAGTALDAWNDVCDYASFGSDAFNAQRASAGSWLFDRPTALYRGYAMTGQLGPLRSAWREASTYRAGTTISNGVATAIPVPGASSDLKYHYAQGLAIHYLLSGDDRYREAAEAVAMRARQLWTSPEYAGGSDFWTERHAGFGLLAYEWAAIVSDDRAATFTGYAQTAVDAYLAMQTSFPANYADAGARCFAHQASAHGESYGYVGCSPWMSAILADGLDAYQRRVGGTRATAVKQALVKLGRIIARDGRDATGRPLYWMGVGTTQDLADDYDEHWGESAYIVAMAWHHAGRTDATLRRAADELVTGLRTRGEAGQLRSFNWQCRSAVSAPFFLE
jgi:hypothetical protein